MFAFGNFLQFQAEAVHGRVHLLVEAQAEHGIAQRAAHQELKRQVVRALAAVLVPGVLGAPPPLHKPVSQSKDQGVVEIMGRAGIPVASQSVIVVSPEIVPKTLLVHAEWR